MVTATGSMTADELLAMPDDGFLYELVRGELRKMPPPGYDHELFGGNIYFSMRLHVHTNRLGRVSSSNGFLLAPDHVRAPDVGFVLAERARTPGATPGYFPGPPDIAVEVISPNDRYGDVEEKVEDWLAAGTLVVIVVNPRSRTVRIHRPGSDVATLHEDDILEVPEVIPGWRMPIREIFE